MDAPRPVLSSQPYPPSSVPTAQSLAAEYGGDTGSLASHDGGHNVTAVVPPTSVAASSAPTSASTSSTCCPSEGTAGSTSNTRQPLQESTGNAQHQAQHQAQHHQVPSLYPPGQYPLPSLQPVSRSCTPALSSTPSLSILTGPLPAPPILASNAPPHPAAASAGPGSAVAAGGGSGSTSSLRVRRYHEMVQKRNRNPIYDCPEFAQYRLKQKDKDRQVWPDVLEHAFLDALLLILHMGRRKFYMGGKQHGRNMIISEYIWLRWVATLPPGTNPSKICEIHGKDGRPLNLPDEHPGKYHDMYRKRKQVSSHIQVLKGFFRLNWAYNFLFSKGKEEGSKDKNKQPAPNRWYKENTDQRSFKGDPVLTALERKQLPTVRPNYEYFRQLLAMDTKVQVRPSTCWIYVANTSLRDQPSSSPSLIPSSCDTKKPILTKDGLCDAEDGGGGGGGGGSGYGTGKPHGTSTVINTYHTRKGLLFREDFPHRYAFNNPPMGEESPWTQREREVRNIRHKLLHEYAWPLKQTESSSAREVLDEWEVEHPDLHAMLTGVMEQHNLQNAHALPVNKLCDIIHVDVTFDVHRVHSLPEGTSFEWPFKISVAQPGLMGHDWRVRTWLERPVELARSNSGKGEVARGEGMVRTKHEKAMMNEMTHVRGCGDDNPHCDCRNRHMSSVWLVPIPANTWAESLGLCAQFPRYLVPKKRGSGRLRREDEMPESDTVTQMDLMRGTAMFQELWSSAPVPAGSLEQPTWTRRAVILWTFNTIHFFDKDNNLCETPAGTQWRFLSAVDPLSAVHQERMLLDASPHNDRGVMSPSPSYQQLLNSQMAENMSAVWGLPSAGGVHSAPASMPVSPMATYGPSPIHVHGSFSNGLVTPPASATLPSAYAFEGATSMLQPQGLAGEHMGYMPVTSVDAKSSFVADSLYTAPFLPSTTHSTFYDEADDNESDTTLPGETTDLTGFGAHQWSNLNSTAHSANSAVALDWDNHALHSLSMVAQEMAGSECDARTTSFAEDVQQQLQQSYDPFAQLRAEARERRMHSPDHYSRQYLQPLRESIDLKRARQDGANDHQVGSSQAHRENLSSHLSQSTTGWDDDVVHNHYSQPHADDRLVAISETSKPLQDYGSVSLSPLLNRKRRREDNDDEDDNDSHKYHPGPMPSYPHRDNGRYMPASITDRQEDQTWSLQEPRGPE